MLMNSLKTIAPALMRGVNTSMSKPSYIVSIQTTRAKCSLPDLPYDYNSLEPYISADIMKLHHSKHHQTYVNNYNVAEEQLSEAVAKGDQSKIIR